MSLKISLRIKGLWDEFGLCFDNYNHTSWGHDLLPCRWEVETDEIVLQRRQKQIDYGKRTPGYQCFLQQVPK